MERMTMNQNLRPAGVAVSRRFALLPRVAAAACLAVLLMSFPACGTDAPPGDGYLRYRMREEPKSLDPHDANDENALLYIFNVFDGLVEFKPGSLEIAPAVAESWEVSEDALTYTFRLREGVRFHNGREVTADDVIYSLKRALNPKNRANPRTVLTAIRGAADFVSGESPDLSGATAPDPRTVVLALERPSHPFISALATQTGSIVPKEIYDDPEKGYLRHPVGCGPFRFEAYESGLHLKMAAFAGHWKGAPAIPGITVRIIPDVNTAFLEYRTGGLEITNEVPPGQRVKVREEMASEYLLRQRISTAYVLLNHASGPLSDNPTLRRALNFAVDRERIATVLQEGKDIATSRILPAELLGGSPAPVPYRHDPDQARRLLAEAGYPEGEGLPELTLLTSINESIRRYAVSIQSDLAQIGVQVRLDSLEFSAYLDALIGTPEEGPSVDMVTLIWFADYPDPEAVLGSIFHSSSPGNFSKYHNPEADRLLDEAGAESDPARRRELYLKVEEFILADGGVLPLYHQGDDMLVKPNVTNIRQSPLGDFAIPLELARYSP
jgi:ABC-type transport system substrate-binding protein